MGNEAEKSLASAVEPALLPATTASVKMKITHYQACRWKHVIDQVPIAIDPLKYDWSTREGQNMLVMVHAGVKMFLMSDTVFFYALWMQENVNSINISVGTCLWDCKPCNEQGK